MRALRVPLRRRIRMSIILTAAAPLLLPLLSGALMWPIETRFHRTDLEAGPRITGFIALGGVGDRIDEAVALGVRHREAKVVVTGHAPLPAAYFDAKGMDRERLLIEASATNTYENATRTAQLLGAEKTRRWILVTSASHMPRAMGCFRKAGFAVEPWSVPDRTQSWSGRLHKAAHEWAGLLVYWLDGRTDALFPSPDRGAAMATAAISAERAASGGSATR